MSDKKFPADTIETVNDAILALGFDLRSKEADHIWALISLGFSDGAMHALKDVANDSP